MTDDPDPKSSSPTALLKFGGEVVGDTAAMTGVLEEVARLTQSGWRFVLCHGGGPQAESLQQRLAVPVRKVGGRRVTDDDTLQIMKCVLAGEVNVDVVAAAAAVGMRPVGISGVSGGLVRAHRRPPKLVSGGGNEPVDFGWVGDIDAVDPTLLLHLWTGGYTPVVNTLGIGEAAPGRPCPVFNINADTVATAIAAALRVEHLFLLTNVPGVLRDRNDPSTRIPKLTAAQARDAIEDGTIAGGMIPKVEEALEQLERGIGTVHILGSFAGLAAEARAPGTCGTALVRQ